MTTPNAAAGAERIEATHPAPVDVPDALSQPGGVRHTTVKFCGLTRAADAHIAQQLGAAYLGVIMAGGPRNVDVETAARILGPRRPGIGRVVVFGTQSADEIIDVAAQLDLDVAQLHATRRREDIRRVLDVTSRAVWPVLRVEGAAIPADWEFMAVEAGALVLDAHVPGQLGGTGVALDWQALVPWASALRARHPDLHLVLAGGLRPANVETAIRTLAPDVVDVSSGVEAVAGVKDPVAMERFVDAVHRSHRP